MKIGVALIILSSMMVIKIPDNHVGIMHHYLFPQFPLRSVSPGYHLSFPLTYVTLLNTKLHNACELHNVQFDDVTYDVINITRSVSECNHATWYDTAHDIGQICRRWSQIQSIMHHFRHNRKEETWATLLGDMYDTSYYGNLSSSQSLPQHAPTIVTDALERSCADIPDHVINISFEERKHKNNLCVVHTSEAPEAIRFELPPSMSFHVSFRPPTFWDRVKSVFIWLRDTL